MNNLETGEKLVKVFSVDGEDIYLSQKEFQMLGVDGALAKYSALSPKEIRDALSTLGWLQSPRPPRDFKEQLFCALDILSKTSCLRRRMRPIVERHLKAMESSLACEELTIESLMQQFFPSE